jgi:diguanylate cyclase (GGDEF)-like protein/PAS domain S-box-containing protein
MKTKNVIKRNLTAFWQGNYRVLVPIAVLTAVVLSLPAIRLFDERSSSMLQLHLLLELFAVLVALLIAVVSWHALEDERNTQAGVLLAGFGAVAIIDLVHAVTWDGMPKLITEASTHRAIFFWLAGRSLVLLTLLLVAWRVHLKLKRQYWLAITVLISAVLFWFGTYYLDWIPNTYIKGQGVTRFKTGCEYALVIGYFLLGLLLVAHATSKDRRRLFGLASAAFVMAIAETVFAYYTAPSDFLNTFGHVLKIISYAFLYQTVFVFAIRQPYQIARQSEERFRALTGLSADWFWEQDAAFRFIQVSAGVSTFAQSPIGLKPWDMSSEILGNTTWEDHRKVLKRHEPFKDFITSYKTASGEHRWISSSGAPIFGEKEKFLGYRGVSRDITDRMAAEETITFLAYHDPLTGLANRLLLQDRFEQAKAHAIRTHTKLALLFLDLDNFKSINDTLGHDVGDALLRQIAERLESLVRSTDIVCRQGGDEFLIILSDFKDPDEIVPVLDKLVDELQKPFAAEGHELTTSLSMGAAVFPQDGATFDDLRKKADLAMYRAKDSGRNTYRFFDENMNAEAINHLLMVNGLRRGIERGEFMLHYQPQFDLSTGTAIGVEALIRWNHPEMGIVSPAAFIPVAEESGLIVQIGAWALQEACRQAAEWQRAGLPRLTIGVNLSAVQFRRGDVEKSVAGALQASGLDPSLLELEITESILIDNMESVVASLERLKQIGVKLAIDDFGTGYSSLSYLKRLAIDKLKIDQSFVRDLVHDADDEAIVRAIIQMAQSLKLKTIAEGIENAELLQKLRIFGCDEGQGHHFARPMPAQELADFLQASQQKKSA